MLFESADGGASWELNAGLWEEPTRGDWQPGGGGLCLHSISTWPGDPQRLAVAISAAGVWLSGDGGKTWRQGGDGLKPRYLPAESLPPEIAEMQEQQRNLPVIPRCVHHMERSPARPERMFIQFRGGVYRSDDAGAHWTEIGGGLPSDFGFPLALDPADPDSALVIPLVADTDRVTPEGRVRVYETRDGGETWQARSDGLPQENAYLTVLRQAFDHAGQGEQLELYFGTTTGDLFASGDAGATWATLATHLPPIYSVVAG